MYTFKSRIDSLLYYPSIGISAIFTFFFLWKSYIVAWIVFMLWLIYLVAKVTNTFYVIHDDGVLSVRSGYLFSRTINISDIKAVESYRGKKFKLSYALSVDGLLLTLTDGSTLYISPRNKEHFSFILHRHNPNISVRI